MSDINNNLPAEPSEEKLPAEPIPEEIAGSAAENPAESLPGDTLPEESVPEDSLSEESLSAAQADDIPEEETGSVSEENDADEEAAPAEENTPEEAEETASEEEEPLPRSGSRTGRILMYAFFILLAFLAIYMTASAIYASKSGKSFDPFGFLKGSKPTLPQLPVVSIVPTQPTTLPTQIPVNPADLSEESLSEAVESLLTSEPVLSSEETVLPEDTSFSEEESSSETEAVTSEESSATEEPTTEEITTEELTSEETEEPTTPSETQDPLDLLTHLNAAGMTEEELVGTQLIVVQSSDTADCKLYFFEKTEDGWTVSPAVSATKGVLGRGGLKKDKQEGDNCTPIGYFLLGPAYGAAESALTALDYHQIIDGDVWVTDPSSSHYNQLCRRNQADADWQGCEDMYALLRFYKYCILINYNTDPVVPGAGSAIFLHVQDDVDTSGCVSTSEAIMFAIFGWLDPANEPHILIY
ncbi:MAG: L,D-transpeptidase family protein [Lachnospiraceae bacterium]|nr:L,D-transpeptidase family protein [Lachnospiraceae bacterium]